MSRHSVYPACIFPFSLCRGFGAVFPAAPLRCRLRCPSAAPPPPPALLPDQHRVESGTLMSGDTVTQRKGNSPAPTAAKRVAGRVKARQSLCKLQNREIIYIQVQTSAAVLVCVCVFFFCVCLFVVFPVKIVEVHFAPFTENKPVD